MLRSYAAILLFHFLVDPMNGTTAAAAFQFSSSPYKLSSATVHHSNSCHCHLSRTTLDKVPSSIFIRQQQRLRSTTFLQKQTPASRLSMMMTTTLLSDVGTAADAAGITTTTTNNFLMLLLQNTNVWVFVIGVVPFAWATVEFWRRIIVGEPFGTGKDSVVFSFIGKDDAPQESRGRRVLGKGALLTAYFLFVLAFGTMAVVLYSVGSSAPPPTEFVSTAATSTPL
jgi:hypothetical protein